MPVTVEWANSEKSIIVITRTEPWSWEAYRGTGDKIGSMLDSVSHPVDLIDDLHDNSYMPSAGFVEHVKWATETYHTHPNVRVVIDVIGKLPGELFKSARDLYSAPGRAYFYVNTLNQAYAILAERFQNLPNE